MLRLASMHFSRARASDNPLGSIFAEIDRLPSPVQTVVHPKGHRALCRDVDIHPVAVAHFVVFFIWFQRSTRWVSSRHRCGKSCRS
jgi:hypothetical protein